MLRIAALCLLVAGPALAGPAAVVGAKATQTGDTWRFDVTVRHGDTGWDHYADGWRVLDGTGAELGYRKLHHPHENEQPFTRSLSGVAIPEGLSTVVIQAHDSVHGWGDTISLDLK